MLSNRKQHSSDIKFSVKGFSELPGSFVASDDPSLVGKTIFGIDIGSEKIRGVAGFFNKQGKVELTATSDAVAAGFKNGIVSDVTKASAAIKSVINDLTLFTGEDAKVVFVSVCGSQLLRHVYKRVIRRKNAKEAVSRNEITQLFKKALISGARESGEVVHIFSTSYALDNNPAVSDPLGLSGSRMQGNFQVMVGSKTYLKQLDDIFKQVGLKVSGFIPAYVASAASVLSDEEIKEGVALVDIGSVGTDLLIYKGGALKHTSYIPLGGSIITSDIANACMLSYSEAEMLKLKSGSAFSELVNSNDIAAIPGARWKEVSIKALSQIIQARVEEIFERIMDEIKIAGVEHQLDKGIVITGGGANLKHIASLVETIAKIPARVGFPVEKISSSIDMQMRNPMNAASIGLVVKGFDYLKQKGKNL